MKKSIFFTLLIVVSYSCSEFNIDEFPQKWQLVKISTDQIPNVPVRTGTDMEYQEFYLLNSDGTFLKSREKDGNTTEASGSFIIKDNSGEKYFELIFSFADDPLIGSCNSGKEELLIKTEKTMVGTWSNCDGPILEYRRVK